MQYKVLEIIDLGCSEAPSSQPLPPADCAATVCSWGASSSFLHSAHRAALQARLSHKAHALKARISFPASSASALSIGTLRLMAVFTIVLVCPKSDLILPAERSDLLNLIPLQAL